MERHRASSQMSIDRKMKDALSSNKQNRLQMEIDEFIQQTLLNAIVAYDPKLNFNLCSIVKGDQALKQTRRQTYGLIWNSIRSPTISRFIREDRSCAFVEILHPPLEWSRYDTDLFLIQIRQKRFLNGFALRDEFVRILQVILKRDFLNGIHRDRQYPFEYKDMDFTRNKIELIFTGGLDPELSQLTIVISLVLLVEFDVSPANFFAEVYPSLCAHKDISDYFSEHVDGQRTRLTPFNAITFLFDYSSTETNLCDFILARNEPLAAVLKGFLKLRKEWTKNHLQRAAKFASDTIKSQIHTEKQRQSTCSVNSVRSGTSTTSNMSRVTAVKVPLINEIEAACEFLFSVSLLRLLFLTVCVQNVHFGSERDNSIAFAIEKGLKLFGDAFEANFLEHPFFPGRNVLPESVSSYEPGIRIGIKKLIQDMQREWKRNIRR